MGHAWKTSKRRCPVGILVRDLNHFSWLLLWWRCSGSTSSSSSMKELFSISKSGHDVISMVIVEGWNVEEPDWQFSFNTTIDQINTLITAAKTPICLSTPYCILLLSMNRKPRYLNSSTEGRNSPKQGGSVPSFCCWEPWPQILRRTFILTVSHSAVNHSVTFEDQVLKMPTAPHHLQ